VKRKAERDAAVKASKTPKKNLIEIHEQGMGFSVEFAEVENPMKGANRNSKQGQQGE